MIEPIYNKVKDFGVEFVRYNDGTVRFLGLSLFETRGGAYTGSLLATEMAKREVISKFISLDLLDEIVCRLECNLASLLSPLGDLSMCLGVDMMLYDDCGVVRLNPCIEVNLRMTMGAVTALFAQRFLAEGVSARFEVVQSDAETMRRLAEENPPLIEDGKYCGGVLMLTPIYHDARYFAFVRGKR